MSAFAAFLSLSSGTASFILLPPRWRSNGSLRVSVAAALTNERIWNELWGQGHSDRCGLSILIPRHLLLLAHMWARANTHVQTVTLSQRDSASAQSPGPYADIGQFGKTLNVSLIDIQCWYFIRENMFMENKELLRTFYVFSFDGNRRDDATKVPCLSPTGDVLIHGILTPQPGVRPSNKHKI